MMLKKFRCLIFAMVLILVVISCTAFAEVKPVKIVYGHIFPANHYYTKADRYFKKLVEKNSKGQILVDVFPAGQIGSQVEMVQATKSGAQQIILTSPGGLTQLWPKFGTFDLPFLFYDQKHYLKVVKSLPSLINQDELAAKTGMHILSARTRAPRHITTKIPINKLEDLKGIKMRCPESAIMVAFFRALGTNPLVIPGPEVYTALATGTVEAQENPFDNIYGKKLYEVQKYCALTAHMQEINIMFINNNFWKSLSAKQQKIISDAAVKSAKMSIKDDFESENNFYKLLKKEGMKFTKPDLTPFRERVQTVWSQFGDKELIQKVQALK
jgi:tripartite ATP-independent transporter DctP family solute receptor